MSVYGRDEDERLVRRPREISYRPQKREGRYNLMGKPE